MGVHFHIFKMAPSNPIAAYKEHKRFMKTCKKIIELSEKKYEKLVNQEGELNLHRLVLQSFTICRVKKMEKMQGLRTKCLKVSCFLILINSYAW